MIVSQNQEQLDALAQSEATNLLEGLSASEDAKAIFSSFAAGEISLEEMGRLIDELHDRKFGSVPLPRD